MNINEIFRNERKDVGKIKGYTYKINNVSPTMCFSVSNLVPSFSPLLALLTRANRLRCICLFIFSTHH